MATKKEAIARKTAWKLALAEGRVVRFSDIRMTGYPTKERAEQAVKQAHAAGLPAEIVEVRS
jgi:hypothetical protein